MGSIEMQQFYATFDVLSIFENPNESLALLRFKKAVLPELTSNRNDYRINFVCLPKEMIVNTAHEDALLSGFGYTNANNNPPNNRLRSATLLIDPFPDCDRHNLQPMHICGTEHNHMTCTVRIFPFNHK